MAVERTLVILKPDAVQRGLTGEIIGRLERRGLKIVGLDMRTIDRDVAARHYAEHEGKPFYAGLIDYITSGPVVLMVLEGPNAVAVTRSTMGKTNPVEAAPGTIRGRSRVDDRSQFDSWVGRDGECGTGDRALFRGPGDCFVESG